MQNCASLYLFPIILIISNSSFIKFRLVDGKYFPLTYTYCNQLKYVKLYSFICVLVVNEWVNSNLWIQWYVLSLLIYNLNNSCLFCFSQNPVSISIKMTLFGNEIRSLARNIWRIIRRSASNIDYQGQRLQVVGDLIITKYIEFVNITESTTSIESSATTMAIESTPTPTTPTITPSSATSTSSIWLGQYGK